MGLTIITPASTRQLTSLAALRDELGSNAVNEALGQFQRLIDRASAAVEAACRRIFAQQVYEQIVPAVMDMQLLLSQTPIQRVISVRHDTEAIADYRVASALGGVLFRRDGWWVISDMPEWTVRYVSGYVLPEQAMPAEPTGAGLPGDVEQVAIETIKVWWRESDPRTRVASRQFDGQHTSYPVSASQSGLPPMAVKILQDGGWIRPILR